MELNKFIRYSRCPDRKFGIEVGTALLLGGVGGALLGAGGSVAGSAIAASGAKDTNSQQMQFTQQENEKNREWQSVEADKNRQWQEQQWDYQFNKTFGSQLQQFRYEQDYINNYNSPQAQVRRLQDAGLNPALALGTGATGTASSTPVTMTSPATPSGSMPSSVGNAGINLENPGSYWGQGLANSFSAFANGFKQLITSGPEGKKLAADAEKGLAEAVYLKSMKSGQDLQNIILKGTKDERLKQAILETQKMSNDVWLQGLKGTQMDAETDRIIQDTMVKKAEECLTYAKTDQQRQEIKAYFINLRQQWSYWRGMSSAAQTGASAQMVNAKAMKDWLEKRGATEDVLRPLLKENQEIQNKLAKIQTKGSKLDVALKDATFKANVTSAIQRAAQAKIITAAEAVKFEQAIKDNDWKTLEKFTGVLGNIGSAYRDFGIGNRQNIDAAESILDFGF